MSTSSSQFAPAVSAVENLTDQAAAKTDGVIQSTRNVANSALDSLQSGVDNLRHAAPAALSRAAAQVEDLTRRSLERARDASSQVKQQVAQVGDKSVNWIRDEPVKSVLIAAAAGAAMAALISWLARSRTPNS